MKVKHLLHVVTYDPLRKGIAIIFAFGLWLFVSLDGTYQYEKELRTIYLNLRDSLTLVDSIAYIPVILNGRGSTLFSIWAAPPKARCDLIDLGPGTYKIPVQNLFIPVSFSDITITHIIPQIAVSIDTVITNQAAISVPFEGTPKDGYSVSDIRITDTIMMTGPKQLLQSIETVNTETLDVRNREITFTKQMRIKPPSNLIRLSNSSVTIEVMIDETIERRFHNIPLTLIFTPYQKVTSEKVILDTLVVKGPRRRIDALTQSDITVRISLTQLDAGDYELPATILLPDYVYPVSSYPQRFKVTLY